MLHILIDVEVDKPALARLRAIPGVRAEALEDPREEVRPLPADLLSDKHVLFCTFPPRNFSDLSSLKLVQITSAGYNQLYGLGLPEKGIRACNSLGVFDVPIAEWNVAMMINLARDLRGMIRNQEAGVWERPATFQREIRGLVAGFWGYGGIGRETARLCKALGLLVHALVRREVKARSSIYCVPGTGDREGNLPDRVFLMEQKDEFLAGLDFLILAMPITSATEGIVGEEELHKLKRTAYVLNPARGPLIREAALLRALREGWIAGAALDTHYHYPMPADHPLWRFPNVIMTPHISGSSLSQRYRERVWDICLQNVERFQAGLPLLNELTAEQLQGG